MYLNTMQDAPCKTWLRKEVALETRLIFTTDNENQYYL